MFFIKLVVCWFIIFMKEEIWVVCWWRVLIMLFEILVRELIWLVKILILFIVVVLNKLLNKELINGKSDLVIWFDFFMFLKVVWGIRVWIDFIVWFIWIMVFICKEWI